MSLLAPFDARPVDTDCLDVGGRRTEVVEFVVHALLSDASVTASVIPQLEAVVDGAVVVTGPSVDTTSRSALVSGLLESDDAITEVTARIARTTTIGPTVFVEWTLSGRFTNPAFLDDDVLVEPSGRSVEASGMMILRFRDDVIIEIQLFYDQAALLEQVLGG